MIDGKKKPKLISTPREFRQQYLSGDGQVFCEVGGNTKKEPTHNFLEVIPLERIKSFQQEKAFAATRRNFYTVVLITRGKIRETIGFQHYEFGANTLYFVPEGQLHTIEHWSNDIKGFHCIFDADYFLLCLRNQVKLHRFPFFQADKDCFLKISDTASNALVTLFEKMNFEYRSRKSHNDDLLVRLYLNVLLIEIERIFQHKQHIGATNIPRKQQLVVQYRKLVAQYYLQKRQVSDYAALLYVTPHYLNDTVKAITGKPASEFIYDQLVREAKAQLIQTENTITQIAGELNFADQSYFCRFFRKQTGASPKQFRQNHLHKT